MEPEMKFDTLAEIPTAFSLPNFNSACDLKLAQEDQRETILCINCGPVPYWIAPASSGQESRKVCAECGSEYFWALAPSSLVHGPETIVDHSPPELMNIPSVSYIV
jgi:hypothetical protein